jgi:hypothetical protein
LIPSGQLAATRSIQKKAMREPRLTRAAAAARAA